MGRKRIKLFLGGFINTTNAQNINCLAIAKYIDKKKYDVYTLVHEKGDYKLPKLPGVTLWTAHLPYRIYKYIIWLRAVIVCDILYLPKGELPRYIAFWKKLLIKKSFSTIEGVFAGNNYTSLINIYGSKENMLKTRKLYDRNYSITEYMLSYNEKYISLKSDGILHLGIDVQTFKKRTIKGNLTHIIFIGNNIRHKGIEDYFKMAESLPDIKFHICGGGGNYNITAETAKRNLPNITLHGSLSHEKLAEVLTNIQLMFFPSRSEGFPKVTLECAATGIPSIVYDDYGADEWITTYKDGFVVKTFDEAKYIIEDLKDNPDKLAEISRNAIELGQRFDWKNVIKEWEEEIDNLAAL